MGRLPSQQERIRRPNAGDIPLMPALQVMPEGEHHETPVPGTLPLEHEEDDAMEEEHLEKDAPQAPADDEDDDEEMMSYRHEEFGAGTENDDSDHEEVTAPAGKKQRTACLNRVINALTANCVALEKSIAAKEAEMMNAGIEASTLECQGSTGCFPVAETCIQVVADEEAPNQRKDPGDAQRCHCISLSENNYRGPQQP